MIIPDYYDYNQGEYSVLDPGVICEKINYLKPVCCLSENTFSNDNTQAKL